MCLRRVYSRVGVPGGATVKEREVLRVGIFGAGVRSPSRRCLGRGRRAAAGRCSRIYRSGEPRSDLAGCCSEDGVRRTDLLSPVLLFAKVRCALILLWKIWGWGSWDLVFVAGDSGYLNRSIWSGGVRQFRLAAFFSLAGRGGEGRDGGFKLSWCVVVAAGWWELMERDLATSVEVRRRWAQVRRLGSLGCVPGRCSFIVFFSGSVELVCVAAHQRLWREAFSASWCDFGSDGLVAVGSLVMWISSSIVVRKKKDRVDLCAIVFFFEVLFVRWLQLCLRPYLSCILLVCVLVRYSV